MAPKSSKKRGGAGKPKVGKGVRAAVKKAAAKPVVRNNDLPEYVLKIKRKPTYKKGPFDRKVRALQKLSDEGKLFKQANPVARDKKITADYKKRIRQKIFDKYWPHDKKMANALAARLRKQQPDHVWELQLGGADDVSNLKLLHGRTNWDVGGQIWRQIMNLPDGTPIRIEVVD